MIHQKISPPKNIWAKNIKTVMYTWGQISPKNISGMLYVKGVGPLCIQGVGFLKRKRDSAEGVGSDTAYGLRQLWYMVNSLVCVCKLLASVAVVSSWCYCLRSSMDYTWQEGKPFNCMETTYIYYHRA